MTSVGFCIFVAAVFSVFVQAQLPKENCVIKTIEKLIEYVEIDVNSTNSSIWDTYTKSQTDLESLTKEFQAYMSDDVYGRHVLQIQLAQQNALNNGKDISECKVDENIIKMQYSLNVMYYEFTLCTEAIGTDAIEHVNHSMAQLQCELINVRELLNKASIIEEKNEWEVLAVEVELEKVRLPKDIDNIKTSIISLLSKVHDLCLKCVETGMDRVAIGLDDPHNTVMTCLYPA